MVESVALPPSALGVLREALDLVRRRAVLFAVLAVAVVVLPGAVLKAVADFLDVLLPARTVSPEGDLAALMMIVAFLTLHSRSVLLDVLVVSVAVRDALGPFHPLPNLARTGRRLLSLAVPIFLLNEAWTTLIVPPALNPGAILISCWVFIAPIWVVERPRLWKMPGRIAAITRGHRQPVVAVAGCYLILVGGLLPRMDALLSSLTRSVVVEEAVTAAFPIFAATTAAVLYAALRRSEGKPFFTLAASA